MEVIVWHGKAENYVLGDMQADLPRCVIIDACLLFVFYIMHYFTFLFVVEACRI